MRPFGTFVLTAAAFAGSIGLIPAVHTQTVTPLPPGRVAIAADIFDRTSDGYVIQEFFVAGTANSYRQNPDASSRDHIVQTAETPYKTRIVVIRPRDPARFNGTAVVEWNNVTSSADAAPDWNYVHREAVRSGYAYVSATVQRAGLDGGGVSASGLKPLKQADPARYGSLSIPNDGLSYDIYSQIGKLVGTHAATLLGPLKPKRVLSIGESQSAAYLVTYINTFDPLAKAYDGYLIHSRFKSGAQVNGDFHASLSVKDAAFTLPPEPIRSDVRVPVLMFIAETDLLFKTASDPNLPIVGYYIARQPDAQRIRTWEVAGSAHADTYTLLGGTDTGDATTETLAKTFTPMKDVFGMPLAKSINAAPQAHYVLQAALAALNNWVTTNKAPPSMPELETIVSGATPTLVRDRHGNAMGGIRTPWMDVPTAVHSGYGQTDTGSLRLFGSTVPFDAKTLTDLYPGGKREYVERFATALDEAICKGVILPADREEILSVAEVMFPQ